MPGESIPRSHRRRRQKRQDNRKHSIELFLRQSRDGIRWRHQTAHCERRGFVADGPGRASVDGRLQRECLRGILVRLRRAWNDNDCSIEGCGLGENDHRSPLPELWKLRVLRKIAPVKLTYFRCGFDPRREAWRRLLVHSPQLVEECYCIRPIRNRGEAQAAPLSAPSPHPVATSSSASSTSTVSPQFRAKTRTLSRTPRRRCQPVSRYSTQPLSEAWHQWPPSASRR